MEKALGWNPIPLFDRDNYPELASMQVIEIVIFGLLLNISKVGFFGGICIPCYDLLSKVMPTVTPMLEQCQANLGKWKKLAEARKMEKIEQEKKEKEEAEKKEDK